MSIPILEACRKRKRRPKLYGFHSFGNPGYPINPIGPFRDNVRVFLQNCAELEEYNIQGMPIWCTLLVHENRSLVIPLYTIEEDVEQSPRPYCDQCRCTGWSNHFVSKKKYHIVIPMDDVWNKPLDEGLFNLQTHLLHGLIHCNGFGHLLCINGIEGGSKYLCGRELMDLWDRICTNLRTRKMTVEDTSKKRSMDLRLLHGVAYRHPWFGRWGYKFGHGSFGVTKLNYDRALEVLSSLQLETIVQDFTTTDHCQQIRQIICHYRDLSETQLLTIKDLLRFMLTVKSRTSAEKPHNMSTTASSFSISKVSTRTALQNKIRTKEKPTKYRKFSTVVANMDSRWPGRRLEFAADVIVSALKEKKEQNCGHSGMTRQDVRDAARLHIGDTGLLDYVLKSMNNVIIGNYIVRRAVNPTSRILEYTIHEEGDHTVMDSEPDTEIALSKPQLQLSQTLLPGVDVYNDVVYLYKQVLVAYPESESVQVSTQVVLDTRHFVKEWPFKDEEEQLLTFICNLMPSLSERESEFKKGLPPGEIVVVPLHATVEELKKAAEIAFRETYCITEKFTVTEIENFGEREDDEVLFGMVESGMEVNVRGFGLDLDTPLRYQGGTETWMVRCECGARDDDGERMVACDICEIWQHTRCSGIEDADTLPPLFVCSACCVTLVPPRTGVHYLGFEQSDDSLLLGY